MWVQAGFEPDSFWHQSPATFRACMVGVRKRLEQEFEMQFSLAWHTAAFTGATQSKQGLKPLKHYLPNKHVAQSPREMAAMIQSMGARSNMKIRRIEREA